MYINKRIKGRIGSINWANITPSITISPNMDVCNSSWLWWRAFVMIIPDKWLVSINQNFTCILSSVWFSGDLHFEHILSEWELCRAEQGTSPHTIMQKNKCWPDCLMHPQWIVGPRSLYREHILFIVFLHYTSALLILVFSCSELWNLRVCMHLSERMAVHVRKFNSMIVIFPRLKRRALSQFNTVW